MHDIEINIATSSDIPALCEFEKIARITEPEIWIDKFNLNEYKKKMINAGLDDLENNKIILARQDGSVIGRCDLLIMDSLMNFEIIGYIDWIYVLKEYRRKGIGKKLINKAEEYFRMRGVKEYYLFTAQNDEAQKFYHKLGYTIKNREIALKKLI